MISRRAFSIVHNAAQDTDPVYGDFAKKTFDFLESQGAVNFPVMANQEYFADADNIVSFTPEMIAQLMNTNPNTHLSIERLLHGVRSDVADFGVVYRKDITYEMLERERRLEKGTSDCAACQAGARRRSLMRFSTPVSVLWRQEEVSD